MDLNAWAKKHNLGDEAISELVEAISFEENVKASSAYGKSEANISNQIRVVATALGMILWRNNVGAYSEKHPPTPGSRWGLANDSKKMNRLVKSSDLIGITPVKIESHHIGKTLGVFTAIEVKKHGWRFTGTDRENAQFKFIN